MRLALLVAAAALAAGQSADIRSRLDAAASAYAGKQKFIGSVLVAKGGAVLLEKGYGMANLEWDAPNGKDTRFRLGSITKQFTAAAILQLREQKKLSLDDTACSYIEGCPAAWKAITIRQLLTHTSGIPSYTGMKEFRTPQMKRIPLAPMEILMLTAGRPLDFEPGTRFSYDNSGYIFLGIIIERVSREDYADYLERHIFSPLGMNNSGYDVTRTILKNRASGYSPRTGGFRNADYLDMSLPYSAGALYSTTGDLYKWDRALNGESVLSKASKEAMWTAVKNNFGFGWVIAPVHGHKHMGHGGGIDGFSTYIGRFPDDDATVIVLSNNEGGNAEAVAFALAGTLFGAAVKLPTQ